MGKSRYAKTKAAGQAVGLTRYGKLFSLNPELQIQEEMNRQMRRAGMKGNRKGRK